MWRAMFMLILLASSVGRSASSDAVSSDETRALTLVSAVSLALERNPSLAAVREELPAALSRLKVAQAEGKLVGSANTYLSTGTLGSTMPSNANAMPRMYMGVPGTSRLDQNLMFMVPLHTGGRVQSRVGAAGARVEATQQDIDSTILDLAYAVRSAYWQTLYRMELVKVQEENVTEQGERLRVDQAKYDAGKIPLFYVLRDKSELADAEQQLTNARRDVGTALLDLRNAIGLEMTATVSLADTLQYDPVVAEQDAAQRVTDALQNRPEERGLEARTKAAELEVAARKSAYRPQVDAMLMLDGMKASGMGADGGYTVGVVGSLPLLDGGERKASVAEAEAMVRSLEQRKQALDLDIERQVRAALLDLAAANRNVRTALEAVAAAEEDYRVASIGYQAGKLINLEAVSALTALVRARTNVAQATYEYNLAVDAVQRATGVLPTSE